MPSALETLVKILKLEQDTGYKNTAVIGGLQSYADNWRREAHNQAKRPEHHQLIDELVHHLQQYAALEESEARHESIKYMLGRIMGRIPAPPDLPPYSPPVEEHPAPPPPPPAPERPSRPTPAKPERPAKDMDSDDEDDADREEETPEIAAEDEGSVLIEEDERATTDEPEDVFEVEFRPLAAPYAPPSRPPISPRRTRQEMLSPEIADKRLQELQAPTTSQRKIGAKMAEKLEKLGMRTVEDMLYTFPRRYDDYTRMRTLNQVRPGDVVTVVAEVQTIERKQGRSGQPYLLLTLDDSTDCLQVAFFGQPWLIRQFKRGSQLVLSGKVDLFRGEPMMTNPEWELLERENLHAGRIVPVYALTKGLSARTMRRLMHQAVEEWSRKVPEFLPASVLDRTDLVGLSWALAQMHFPDSFETLELARHRLTFDELFLFQMAMMAHRRDWQAQPGEPIRLEDRWVDQFVASLPYTLTGAQRRVLNEIRADLARDVPMNRLLQGDVGSGKTVVAAAAMAFAAKVGKQAALMAPTSILAEQHARSLSKLYSQTADTDWIQVRLLTSNTGEAERQEIYDGLANGTVHLVVGTHALIQEGVNFRDLALVVIDEQHRFGVQQRGLLRGKGTNPHVLVMTATPIPRTLALTIYADLDLSVIDEMPPGRSPIETRVLHPVQRERVYSFIMAQLRAGRQAFIVYPLVETSEKLEDVGSAVESYRWLQNEVFSNFRVGLLHGRLKPAEKDEIMAAFAAGEMDVLVSTSVVEVGIDVPNASVILIENAERFGLAQLHQFRGRVGRGEHKSYCLLMTGTENGEAEERLKVMEQTTNGFELAEMDWRLRGSGDLLGVRQSGVGAFRLAEWMKPQLVELAQREARAVYAEDPVLAQPEHYLLAKRVRRLLDERADVS